MLAPIALYPDPLISQILMAATYPLEVVQADRWLQNPANAALSGDQLAAALDRLPWEPSVKSLVPFPQVLRMMDDNLDWMERLGDAFLADQAAVMDSIQRLRHRAEAAGSLSSTPQAAVTTQGPAIAIEPAGPDMVYIPVYDPQLVYGVWPYPAFPPFYFPGYFDDVIAGGFGFGFGWVGVAIVRPLWGWNHWDWGRHRIDIDRARFTSLNGNRAPPTAVWEHAPLHRAGVPYSEPAVRQRFAGSMPAPDVRRGLRGYPAAPSAPFHPAAGGAPPGVREPTPVAHMPPMSRGVPPSFESFGRGAEVRGQAERGQASRMSAPAFQPGSAGPGAGSRGGPAGGGRRP